MSIINILFIGNSHTYYHYMPRILEKLAQSAFPENPITTQQSTGHGANLEWHWRCRETRSLISRGGWDYVVVQDRSGGPLEEKRALRKYAGRLHGEVRKQGAKTLLYMTWANQAKPETQKVITRVYVQLARELGAQVAPVGMAWESAAAMNPGVRLYAPDGRHAGPSGAYLSACIFFALVYGSDALASRGGVPFSLRVSGSGSIELTGKQTLTLQEAVPVALDRMGTVWDRMARPATC